ncbi:MFS transporter [Methanofollis formosanus]|uniref:MFS transporter n=1 Tax=Methanofollis formosanus TaxID=299308 RepID=A0A8G1A4C6_9EURY|nr:MFS transporter [Methanofollis formosanus]QYZ80184.1 MFS transporter [Methanofollis formosanus]
MKPPFSLNDPRYHLAALFILCITVAATMFTEAMITPALPVIQDEFGVSGVWTSWVLMIVLLVGAIVTPVIGKCGDLYGKKRMMLLCLGVYLVGVFASGWAPDIWSLIFFRALQGAGLGLFPLGYALIREQFPEEKVPVAIGTIAAMFGAGAFVGMFVGSWIIEHVGWRMTFHVVTPVVVLLFLAMAIVILPSPVAGRAAIDRKGLATLTGGLLTLVLALTMGGQVGWASPEVLLCVVLTVGFGAVFVRTEQVVPDPVVDLGMIRNPPVLIALAVGFFVCMISFIIIQTLPYLIESPTGLGLSRLTVGLVMMPGAIADMICGPLTGMLIRRRGMRAAMILGTSVVAAGAACYLFLPLSVASLVVAGLVYNAGMSVALTANTIIVVDSVRPEETGVGTAVYHTVQNLGGMIGPIIAGIFLTLHTTAVPGWSVEVPTGDAFLGIFVTVICIAAVVLLIGGRLQDPKRDGAGRR